MVQIRTGTELLGFDTFKKRVSNLDLFVIVVQAWYLCLLV